jgi:hypothetical protein
MGLLTNNELERKGKEAVVTKFKVFSLPLPSELSFLLSPAMQSRKHCDYEEQPVKALLVICTFVSTSVSRHLEII